MKALLVDDHALFSEGLALLMAQSFESVQCLQAASIAQAQAQAMRHPDVALVLLDLGLPDSEGLQGLARLREALPDAALVVLSADDSAPTVMDSLEAGAQGFIPKTASPGLMREALARVLDGQVYLPEALLQRPTAPADLSERQLAVLRLLIAGRSNKHICRELELSESTVKTHMAALFRKLEVNTRTQAVVKAASLGLRVGR